MRGFERSDCADAVRAHREMDRACGQRLAESPGLRGDADDRRILDEHRDHDVEPVAQVAQRCGAPRAVGHERGNRRGRNVEHGQLVAAR